MALGAWQATVVDSQGNVIPDAEIEVLDAGASTKPDLFSDRDGDNGITNPFTADTNGFAQFFVAGGAYDITATGANALIEWKYVAIGTAAEKDIGTGSDQLPTNADLGLGSAATRDVGTGSADVPLNSDLGSAATRDVGTDAANLIQVSDADARYAELSGATFSGDVEVAGFTATGAAVADSVSVSNDVSVGGDLSVDGEIDCGTVA